MAQRDPWVVVLLGTLALALAGCGGAGPTHWTVGQRQALIVTCRFAQTKTMQPANPTAARRHRERAQRFCECEAKEGEAKGIAPKHTLETVAISDRCDKRR